MLSDDLPQVWHQNDPRVSGVFEFIGMCSLREEGEFVRKRRPKEYFPPSLKRNANLSYIGSRTEAVR
jgi:hypothetical protein